MKVRKSFIIQLAVATLVNIIMMLISAAVINTAIPIVMSTMYYTVEQFMSISVFLSLGCMALTNRFLIKAGLYSTISNHWG